MKDWVKLPSATEQSSADKKLWFGSPLEFLQSRKGDDRGHHPHHHFHPRFGGWAAPILMPASQIENKFSIRSLLFLPMKDWVKLPSATEQSSADKKLWFGSPLEFLQSRKGDDRGHHPHHHFHPRFGGWAAPILMPASQIENKFSIRSLLFLPMKDWAKLPSATEQSSIDKKLWFSSSLVSARNERVMTEVITRTDVRKR